MTDDVPGDLVPQKEAARIAGVHESTMREWIRRGKVRGWSRAGTRLFVSRADAERMVRPVRVQPDDRPESPAETQHRLAMSLARLKAMGVG